MLPQRDSSGRTATGIVVAISLACVALGAQLFLIPVVAVDSYQLFLGAVAVSSIYGGGRAGLLTLLITGLGKFCLLMPSNVLAIDSAMAVRTLLFLAVAGVICWIGGRFHQSEQGLSAVLSSVADALIATDNKGRIQFMNPAAEALSGWPAASAVKHNLFDIIHLRDRASGSMMDFPRGDRPRLTRIDSNTVLDARSGCAIPVAGSFSIVIDGSGSRSGAVLVLRERPAGAAALGGILPVCPACKKLNLCPECTRRLTNDHEQGL